MTVKDKVGRTRYVAFRVEGPAPPRAALDGLLAPHGAKLTRYEGGFGLARCKLRDLPAARQVLNAAHRVGGKDVQLVSLATSGTLRAAARALPPEARTNGPRSRKID